MRAAGPRVARLAALALAAWLGAGCQKAITDVGATDDASLDDRGALPALVAGMDRELSRAVGLLALTGAVVTREVIGAGSQTTEYGATLSQRAGFLDPLENDDHWNLAQSARWTAEDGVRRMRDLLGEDFAGSELAARALLDAGFANRLLGENMCSTVVDGGPSQPSSAALQRADAEFDEALDVAQRAGRLELALAARAGRASARVDLGDWAGARADAEGVPEAFAWRARYSDRELAQYNRIQWATAGMPFRSLSVWSTAYEEYYRETGDPRTPWTTDPDHPEAEPGVPFYIQEKYTARGDPIDLVDGREMRLIVAEARLRDGDVEGAMSIVDELRASAGVDPVVANDLEAAWTALERERGIELWLEGRRLGDLRRWLAEGTPGTREDMTGRDTCFPIGATEIDTNPNVP